MSTRRAAVLAAALLSAAASVALSHVHPFGDPYFVASAGREGSLENLLKSADMPSEAKRILISKCADCHSNATRWPAYAHIPPGSWLMERDVIEGRKHLNLSTWDQLTPERRQVLESKIVRETRAHKMPPLQYLILHWNARLSNAELGALAGIAKQGAVDNAETRRAGDPERGKEVFEKRCTGCHALDADREGPHLRGVFGRKAGFIANFPYSTSIQKSNIRWSEESLDEWLTDTDEMIPGNNMTFRVVKATDRSDVIAYLRQLK